MSMSPFQSCEEAREACIDRVRVNLDRLPGRDRISDGFNGPFNIPSAEEAHGDCAGKSEPAIQYVTGAPISLAVQAIDISSPKIAPEAAMP
jgi:hypothetical protein